ncbi:MAG: cation:proton antiporter [Micromonosporaceae bacterium]
MHLAHLLIEVGGIILALGLLNAFAVRIGVSPIPLYLLAGLAFGDGGLIPLSASTDFISVGAEIGVVLLLFTLGLEYSAAELVTNLRQSAAAGVADLVLNATPGAAVALLLGWGPVGALVMGGVTYVSSSGIIAKLLGDLGWLGNRETPVVLSLLVFEDLTMAVYLPILTTVLAGLGLYTGSVTVAAAVASVAVVLFVALRYGRAVEGFLRSPNDEVLLLKVFGLVLLVAGLAQQQQVSAAVGAFLVGIAVSGELAESARDVLSPLRDLFAAAFFVFFGLQVNPASLPPVALIALALAFVGVLTKLGTGFIAARRAGIGTSGGYRAGAALVPRGEFSIVIAGLAVAAGVDSQLGALAAAYVLVLAMVGPLVARAVEPLLRRRARRARQSSATS